MQLSVTDILQLLAGFGPHSEYIFLKKSVLQPSSSLVYIFDAITIIIQSTADMTLRWNVGHVIWIVWEMH
jgi:hypothetical protein